MKGKYASWLMVVFCFGAMASLLHAQIGTAVVVGRIQDPSGAIIPGAEVQMKRLSTNQVFAALTTETGDADL